MKIAILTTSPKSYKAKRLAEEAVKRGHKVVKINYTKCYCSIVKGKPAIYYKGKQLKSVDAVIPLISVDTTSYGTAIIRQFEMMNIPTTTGSLAFIRSRDKIRSLQLLAKLGLDIPRTVFAHTTGDAAEIVKMVGGSPLIIKVTQGSLGRGVMLAESSKSARSAIEAFFSQKVNILVQEYIEESEGSDIRAFVIDGKVFASIKRSAAEGEFRSNIYQGGSAQPIKLNKEERQLAIKAAKAMHLNIAGVDLVQSTRGPLVMEVNASPNIGGVEEATGKNIAGEMIAYVERSSRKRKKKDVIGA